MNANVPHTRWRISTLVRLAISLILIACIVWWLGGLGKIVAIVERISFGLALVVIFLATLDRALMTFKWLWLLKAKGVHAPFFTAMRIYCASMIWGTFLPSTVGADTIRAVSMTRTGFNANEVVASIVIERVFGFLATLLVGILSLLLLSRNGSLESRFAGVWWFALIMIAVTLIALATSLNESVFRCIHNRVACRFLNKRFAEKLRKLHESYRNYRKHTSALLAFSVLTVAEQMLPIMILWLIALALGVYQGILPFAVAVPLSLLLSRLPIGISGLGTFEAAFAFLLMQSGISAATAVGISFSARILEVIAWLPWWGAHVVLVRTSSRRIDQKSLEPILPTMKGKS